MEEMLPVRGRNDGDKDPFIRRVIVCALVAVFLMAGYSVFILGHDSTFTALLLTLGASLAGIGGWGIDKLRQG